MAKRSAPVSVTLWDKWKLYNAIIADADLSSTGKLVAFRLLDHHNNASSRCTPSYNTIAKHTGLSRRRAIEGVKDLEQRGWLIVDRAPPGSATATFGCETNSFRIVFERMTPSVENGTTPSAVSDTTPSVENDTPPSVISDTQTLETKTLKNIGSPASPARQKGPADEEVDSALVSLKANYPNRPGPKWSKARSKLPAILRRGVSPDLLALKARDYRQQCERERREPQFIQQPDTWLNQEGWTIDYAPVSKGSVDRPAAAYSDPQWTAFVAEFLRGGSWPQALGPSPGSAGCRVPPHILRAASAKAAA
jgi:hypothetical protein